MQVPAELLEEAREVEAPGADVHGGVVEVPRAHAHRLGRPVADHHEAVGPPRSELGVEAGLGRDDGADDRGVHARSRGLGADDVLVEDRLDRGPARHHPFPAFRLPGQGRGPAREILSRRGVVRGYGSSIAAAVEGPPAVRRPHERRQADLQALLHGPQIHPLREFDGHGRRELGIGRVCGPGPSRGAARGVLDPEIVSPHLLKDVQLRALLLRAHPPGQALVAERGARRRPAFLHLPLKIALQ